MSQSDTSPWQTKYACGIIIIMEDFLDKYTTIFNLIGSNKKVLDVGCCDGYIGRLLKQKNNRLVGIEADKTSAERAKKYYEEVIIGDIECISMQDEISRNFDVILYSEILEHLKSPNRVLSAHRKLLNENGFIITVIPNVAFYRNRLSLLFGNWDYEESGVLDRTHLRFYTLKTAKELIQGAGYKITSVKILFHKKRNFNLLKALLVSVLPGLLGLSYVIKAKPDFSVQTVPN